MSLADNERKTIQVTVFEETEAFIQEMAELLNITNGDVINRLVFGFKATSPDAAVVCALEHFLIATKELCDDEKLEATYHVMAMLALPLFQEQIRPETVWFEVLTRVENFLREKSELENN